MIICDDREPENIKKDLNCVVRRLELGNYIVGNLLIERKSPSEFLESLYDSRFRILIKDLMNICDYTPCIVIVGDIRKELAKRDMQREYDILYNIFEMISELSEISMLQFRNQNDFEDFLKICDDEKQGAPVSFLVHKTRRFLISKPKEFSSNL